MRPMLALALCACAGDPAGPTEPTAPVCDGRLQEDESSPDAPFDKDGDGYVDGNDPDCRANYGAGSLDCNDAVASIHPGVDEIACNGLDDDCNSDTVEEHDEDIDGTSDCEGDCDDADPLRFPGNPEICWDEVDNDCDGETDPGCGFDYNGTFDIEPAVLYECAATKVNIDFQQVQVLWNPPNGGSMRSLGGLQPGLLNGTIEPDGTFVFEGSVVIGTAFACSEYYRFTGTFTDADHFTMTFDARFKGGFACLNCENQLFVDLAGTRAE